MTFKEATDELLKRLDHAELAEAMGVSVASIRQARLVREANAYREPPRDWRYAVIRLSERRIMECRNLIEALRQEV